MFKKIRRKFVILALLIITGVNTIIIGSINIANYTKSTKETDKILNVIADNDGEFPKEEFDPEHPPKEGDIGIETPYRTRFFTVRADKENNIVSVDINMIAAVNEERAIEYGKNVLSKNKNKGYLNKYRYLVSNNDDNSKLIIFADSEMTINKNRTFLIFSTCFTLLGTSIFAVLLFIFSKIIFKPVAQSYEKQKQFITDANHELKTPLTVINANCDVLEMMNGENEWTNSIKYQVDRLTILTNELVTLSKLDEVDNPVDFKTFNISEAVKEVADSYTPLFTSKTFKYDFKIEGNVFYKGSEKSIKELINILMDNAYKYAYKDGNIVLNLSQSDNLKHIYIKCSNIAKNIKAESMNYLFERFYRLDDSRNSKTGGHGLGLSIAKSIVYSHNGKIECYSNDGKTINFEIIL